VAAVRTASTVKGYHNNIKDYQGILDGFKRFRVVEAQREKEKEMLSSLQADPEAAAEFSVLLEEFKTLHERQAEHRKKDLVLAYLVGQSTLLEEAMLLYRWSVEKEKRDMDREPEFMERRVPDLRRDLDVFQTQMHLGSERAILKMLFLEAAQLPEGQRIAALDAVLGSKSASELEEAVDVFLDGLYAGTKLDRREERLRMFGLSREAFLAESDAFVTLSGRLYAENQERLERRKEFSGAEQLLMLKWMKALAGASDRELYADANGTMRFSYGNVKGYSPRDAVEYVPFTTLEGVVEKNTGAEPFDCPQKILELAAEREYGQYADPGLGSVAVNLLTTNDSTRGNSGSPVLNSKGEVVGCLFDGNYEGLGHDFAFHEEVTRSIHVDIRYVLWVADLVDDAENVLRELGVK
ncbi:MAG: S46 family peptidase, partial [Candidatus Eisenbacteria bacterium]|nr:S46 family peptidase [Candidatus Eisenbacteria bacterium]